MNAIDKLQTIYIQESDDSQKKYFIDKSKIHGQGVFAGRWLDKELNLGRVTDPYPNVTTIGSKVNHSKNPNCILRKIQIANNIFHDLVTAEDISPNEELTLDYNKYEGFLNADPSWD